MEGGGGLFSFYAQVGSEKITLCTLFYSSLLIFTFVFSKSQLVIYFFQVSAHHVIKPQRPCGNTRPLLFPQRFSFPQTSIPVSIKQLDYELKISIA